MAKLILLYFCYFLFFISPSKNNLIYTEEVGEVEDRINRLIN